VSRSQQRREAYGKKERVGHTLKTYKPSTRKREGRLSLNTKINEEKVETLWPCVADESDLCQSMGMGNLQRAVSRICGNTFDNLPKETKK